MDTTSASWFDDSLCCFTLFISLIYLLYFIDLDLISGHSTQILSESSNYGQEEASYFCDRPNVDHMHAHFPSCIRSSQFDCSAGTSMHYYDYICVWVSMPPALRDQELCENWGGLLGSLFQIVLMVSVAVKQHRTGLPPAPHFQACFGPSAKLCHNCYTIQGAFLIFTHLSAKIASKVSCYQRPS